MIYYLALGFFVLDYIRPTSYIPGLSALRLNSLVPVTAILCTLIFKTQVSNREVFADANAKMLAIFLGLLAIQVPIARVTLNAFTVFETVTAYMLISWVFARNAGDVRRFKGIMVMLIVVHIIIVGLNPGIFSPDSRVGLNSGGFLGDGNDFALSVNVCIPLCLFLLLEARSKMSRVVWVGAVLALVLFVVATKSRGGTLGLGAVMFYFWLKSPRKVLTASLFAVLVVIGLAFAPSYYFERMNTMADTEESSAQGRIRAWRAGTMMALRSPLLGVGPGHFQMNYGQQMGTRWMTAHSIYFLILGELGFPGITLLLTFIFWNLSANKRLIRELNEKKPDKPSTARNALACTSAALVAFAVTGAFLSALYYPHIYVLAALLILARRLARLELAAAAGELADGTAPAIAVKRPVVNGVISPDWVPRPIGAALAPSSWEESHSK